jgi:hypothetical protein
MALEWRVVAQSVGLADGPFVLPDAGRHGIAIPLVRAVPLGEVSLVYQYRMQSLDRVRPHESVGHIALTFEVWEAWAERAAHSCRSLVAVPTHRGGWASRGHPFSLAGLQLPVMLELHREADSPDDTAVGAVEIYQPCLQWKEPR